MKFVNKGKGQPYFWVEDYTPEQKEFFLGLGFTELKSPAPKSFGGKNTLNFKGSGIFGMWDKKEIKKICHAIYEKFPEIEQIDPEVYYPD